MSGQPVRLGDLWAEFVDGYERQGERHENTRTGPRGVIPREVRIAVYSRDGFRCVWCNETQNLQLDHVIPWSSWGPDHGGNLRTLCEYHNQERSNYVGDSEITRIIPALTDCPCCQHNGRAVNGYSDYIDDTTPIWCSGCRHNCHADAHDVKRALQFWHDFAQQETR